jgi:hypothetical protein
MFTYLNVVYPSKARPGDKCINEKPNKFFRKKIALLVKRGIDKKKRA